MEHKEDIGTLLKKKLSGKEKAPSKDLWERVNTSLDKKDQKRKRFFWLRFGSGGIIVALLFAYVVAPPTTTVNHTEKNEKILHSDTSEIVPVENMSSQKEKSVSTDLISEDIKTDTSETILTEMSSNKISSEEAISKKNPDEPLKVSRKQGPTKETLFDESSTVKTNYHYYNSDGNKNIETTDKHVIDSLINLNNDVADTLASKNKPLLHTLKKLDSLPR